MNAGNYRDGDWFALQVKPRWEGFCTNYLQQKGYETLFATYESRTKTCGGKARELVPLFPCYVFCRFISRITAPIVTTPGVVRIVGAGRIPVPIDDSEIEAVRAIVSSGLPRQPHPFLEVGQLIRIDRGSLCGLKGILLSLKSNCRIVVSIRMLQRSVSVEVPSDWVTAAADLKKCATA
jgi:transcriptional antiterminator NusG